MNLHEVVIRIVQRDCGTEVLNLFGERIREPGQSAAVHSQRVILFFNVAGGDQAPIVSETL